MLRPAPSPAPAATPQPGRRTRPSRGSIGRNPADIVTAMEAFKSGQLPSTVMGRIAKGFSDDEVKAIAAWYGAQKD